MSLADLLNTFLQKNLTAAEIAGNAVPSVNAVDRSVTVTLNAASGVVTGAAADFNRVIDNSVAVVSSSAALTAGTIVIEGSIDGTRYFTMQSIDVSNPANYTAAVNIAYPQMTQLTRFMRARIAVALVGGNVTVRVSSGSL